MELKYTKNYCEGPKVTVIREKIGSNSLKITMSILPADCECKF